VRGKAVSSGSAHGALIRHSLANAADLAVGNAHPEVNTVTCECLFLSNEDMVDLLAPEECVRALEEAFRDLGRRRAQELPRRRIYFPQGEAANRYYWFNEMVGLVHNVLALRVNSATVHIARKRGNARLEFHGPFCGLVFLFEVETNKLLAVIQDYYLNPIRVAGTSALVSERLARDNAQVMGLFGSSTQAATQALYHAAMLKQLSEIRVYSTNAARREAFAEAMSAKTGIRVVAVDHPRDAVEGCDIVTTATNSNEPVFSGEWLRPGTHVNTMIGSDAFLARRETDELTVKRSDIIVVNSKESIRLDKQPELYPLLQQGVLSWDDIYEVSDLVIGDKIHGRSSAYQITYHNNNVGMGIQFAALGRLVYEKARALGRGSLVEAGLFVQMPDDLRRIRDAAFLGKTGWRGT